MLIKIIQLLASLSLLVIIHEFGHFLFAKLFKCRVEKFYLFFDYKFALLKKKIGETEFGIGWIPFGGYVKISGMIDESMDKEQMAQEPKPWEYRSKPAWQRLLIIVGGVVMNVILAMFIYIGMTFAWGDQYIKTSDAKDGFSFSQTAKQMGFQDGDKILTIDGDSVESYQTIPQAILLGDKRQVEILRGDTKQTLIITDSMISMMLQDRGFIALRIPQVIGFVDEGSPAETAMLKAGDTLIAVNDSTMKYSDQFKTYFTQHKADTLQLAVMRGTDTIYTSVVPNDKGMIGVGLTADIKALYPISTRTYSLWEAIPAGIERGTEQIGNYIKQLKVIFTPETGAYKEVGGFIAMGKIFPDTWDWFSFWNITALLSIMLAVLNILPIPALDGGHLVFIIYEMIARRPPSQKFMEGAQYVGFILILALVIFANGNDILKLFNF